MNVDFEIAQIKDAEKIVEIQKLAFEESYKKYKFCPAYELETEEVKRFIANGNKNYFIYKIIAQGKNRTGLNWFLVSLLLGPLATLVLVISERK